MTKKKVWRYTCGFCKKSNCSGGAISGHEKTCFRNPNRGCGICKIQWPVEGLFSEILGLSKITEKTEDKLIGNISKIVNHCPACIISAISQAKLPNGTGDNSGYKYQVKFDYKKERDEYNHEKIANDRTRLEDIGGFENYFPHREIEYL